MTYQLAPNQDDDAEIPTYNLILLDSFNSLFTVNASTPLRPTNQATEMMKQETQTLKDNGLTEDGRMGRKALARLFYGAFSYLKKTNYFWR